MNPEQNANILNTKTSFTLFTFIIYYILYKDKWGNVLDWIAYKYRIDHSGAFIFRRGVNVSLYPEGVRVMPHCIINPLRSVAFNKVKTRQRYKQKKFLMAK